MDLSNASKLISEGLLTTAADIGGTKKHNQQKLSEVTKKLCVSDENGNISNH